MFDLFPPVRKDTMGTKGSAGINSELGKGGIRCVAPCIENGESVFATLIQVLSRFTTNEPSLLPLGYGWSLVAELSFRA